MGATLRSHHRQQGMALITAYLVVWLLTSLLTLTAMRGLNELRLVGLQHDSAQAFSLAEAGIQRALWVLSGDPLTTAPNAIEGQIQADNALRDERGVQVGSFQVTVSPLDEGFLTRTITSTGIVKSMRRTVQVQARHGGWVTRIPSSVYSTSVVSLQFDARDDAYVDGTPVVGVYSTDDVISKKVGPGRIEGAPPIAEFQNVPEGVQEGVWDAFDFNALRDVAKAQGTYVSADGTADAYNNPYNKSGRYTLPLKPGQTEGVFFFDAKSGQPLDDNEVNPQNEVRVKLEGTCNNPRSGISTPVTGIIVVVGDLHIKETRDCDFLFNGVIIALDDMTLDDPRHHRRKTDTNDSDIVIRGAVLSDNIIEKGKKRKKKPSLRIKNATVDYDAAAIAYAQKLAFPGSYWGIVPGTWRELVPAQ